MSIQTNNGILARLSQMFKDDLETFLDDFAARTGYSKYDLKKQLDRSATHHEGSYMTSTGANGRSYDHWLFYLKHIYGIGFDDLKPVNNKLFEPTNLDNPSAFKLQASAINFDDFKHNSHKEAYSKLLERPISSLEKELWVYDYLEKHNYANQAHLSEYSLLHDELFRKIEEKVRNGLQYVRVLALPVRAEFDTSVQSEGQGPQDLIMWVLKYCSLPLFEHICRCCKEFPQFEDSTEYSGFYLVGKPHKTYHYAVFDEGKYVMSEFYRYDDEQNLLPGYLQVADGLENTSLVKSHLEELDKVSKRRPLLTLEAMEPALRNILNHSNVTDHTLPSQPLNIKPMIEMVERKLDVLGEYL